jgi:filamentous hemagglutinin family protein
MGGRFAAVLAATVLSAPAMAQHITIDGTLSPARTLAGPNYTIGANLGKQLGGNLFQSFGIFGLSSGESATFTGPATVNNVIGRVTGGSQSSINGAINSTIQGANVYLINPAGIIFGPNATINVTGSFRAASADYLRLSDGSRFQATNPGGSTLSAAPPAAFGFLTATPGAITVYGASLEVPTGKTLALAGGTVDIAGGTLQAPAGAIHLTSVASTGEVPVAPGAGHATVTAHGDLGISAGSVLDVSNPTNLNSGSGISIHAGDLAIDDSLIQSYNYGSGAGANILLSADSVMTLTNGTDISAVALGSGSGGAITFKTGSNGGILIDDSTVSAGGVATGAGGPIAISAPLLQLQDNAVIGSFTEGVGAGGPIAVSAQSLQILSGAEIDSDAEGSGPGGAITANVAGAVVIDGTATPTFETGILAVTASSNPAATGAAGSISLTAGSLTINSNGASLCGNKARFAALADSTWGEAAFES